MSNLPNPAHPPWCLRGPDCAASPGWHNSQLVEAVPRSDSVIQVSAGLWRLDADAGPVGGIMLELSVGADIERWPIDLAQSRALPLLLQGLLRQSEAALPRAA